MIKVLLTAVLLFGVFCLCSYLHAPPAVCWVSMGVGAYLMLKGKS